MHTDRTRSTRTTRLRSTGKRNADPRRTTAATSAAGSLDGAATEQASRCHGGAALAQALGHDNVALERLGVEGRV